MGYPLFNAFLPQYIGDNAGSTYIGECFVTSSVQFNVVSASCISYLLTYD